MGIAVCMEIEERVVCWGERPITFEEFLDLNDLNGERIEMRSGELALETVPGFVLQVEWLFADPRPDEWTLLKSLLED